MKARLMLTCLCDAFYGEVGIAAVKVLEHCGVQVEFEPRQTCCGQPPFNAGDWDHAREMARRTIELFPGEAPVVVPSASCAAMVREGYALLEQNGAPQAYELCEFLNQVVKVTEWPSLPQPMRAGFHRSCHGRAIHLGDTQERTLGLVRNLELVPMTDSDQCCGFGGAFSVTHSSTSREIGAQKLERLNRSGVQTVIGGDMGCFMHLEGLAKREGMSMEFLHIAEVLASAL